MQATPPSLAPSLAPSPSPAPSPHLAPGARSLAGRLARGETTAAVTFAGQGMPVLAELAAIWRDHASLRPLLRAAEERVTRWTQSRELRWSGLYERGFALTRWLEDEGSRPEESWLQSTAISNPLIFVCQVARHQALVQEGLGAAYERGAIRALTGHSQGIMPAVLVAESRGGRVSVDRFVQFLDWMVWQGLTMARSYGGAVRQGEETCMAAISGPDRERLMAVLARVGASLGPEDALALTLENTRTRNVLSGSPRALARVREALSAQSASELAARKEGRRGGRPLSFTWESLAVGGPFHSSHMSQGFEAMREVVAELGFRVDARALLVPVCSPVDGSRWDKVEDLTDALMRAQYLQPVRWTEAVTAAARGVDWVLDVGPGDGVARLSRSNLRGTGARVLALSIGAEPAPDLRVLFTEGTPEPRPPVRWADRAPFLFHGPEGEPRLMNRFVEATGMPPILLPGMTPTTVDPAIVAAAANAGYWAEWAGGGQVTEALFQQRLERLASLLEPGREVVFNALFLDPYLWGLHLGRGALVQRARRAGMPIGGVIVSAGVPEVAEAVALLDELRGLGMRWNGFKPGTLAQIEQVAKIAEAAPHHTLFVQIEGGKAGGHHSWEDLEGLLLDSYGRLSELPNVVLCVGGGVRDEARATELLTGRWALRHGALPMPVDAVFLGTLAMACKEATASPAVKQALVDAAGTPSWVHSGAVEGGVTSGRSQLGADIHYLENSAARAGRLLDEVAGDAKQVAARRPEIIEALSRTAKPYFGDVDRMTWAELLSRAITLMAIGRSGSEDDGPWPDRSYRERVADLIRRAEARIAAQPGPSVLDAALVALDEPWGLLEALLARHPGLARRRVSPADARWFVERVCARPGKPVNFVPVIDQDVRRWYKADSLWQAQDPRYSADQVLIIPGPEAVGGITRADEPVADLLGRFRDALFASLDAPNGHRPRVPTLPREISSEPSGAGLILRVRERPASPVAWLDVLSRAWSGPLMALLGADRLFLGARSVPNPVRALLLAELGASLRADPGPDGRMAQLTWHPADGDREAVRLVSEGETIRLELLVPSLEGQALDPLTLEIGVHHHADGGLAFTLDPAREREALRRHYLSALVGAEGGAVALFEPAEQPVMLEPDRRRAYAALTGSDPWETPLNLAFSLCFGAIFRTLCADELAGGLLRLVHLDNEVEAGPAWPPPEGEPLSSRAVLTRVEDADSGRTVSVAAELTQGSRRIATVRSRFFLRAGGSERYDRSTHTLRTREEIHATLEIPGPAELAFLVSHRWVSLSREAGPGPLELHATLSEERPREGLSRFRAEGLLQRSNQVLGRVNLDLRADLERHPLRALLELLGAPTPGERATPTRALPPVELRAPGRLDTFAEVSGDLNPIHRSVSAARLAGLDGPIVHGMWTAARTAGALDPRRVSRMSARFLAPVLPGEALRVESSRVGLDRGRVVLEATTSALRGDAAVPVLQARAWLRPPRTAAVFPGQGVQRQGMGMEAMARSPAAAAVWAEADRITRADLGFSILGVVRENPPEIQADGARFLHPEGVLNLTAFTQVALAVLANAQVAELREAGALPDAEDPTLLGAGHSLGEYNALGALFGVLPLRTVVRAVWARGLTMHGLVPRDARGESGYRMGVIRPQLARLDHAAAEALVARVREETGSFLQIVNYNVRGKQYAVTGQRAAIDALVAALTDRARDPRRVPWQEVPGIDVPFHSEVLRHGARPFREVLAQVLTPDLPYLRLVGRYVPNLVALPFSLEPDFVRAVAERTDSTELHQALDGTVGLDEQSLARQLLMELLAWQFCSPVRWIETQELMMSPRATGGLGVEQVLEIGPGTSPVLTNMGRLTLSGLGLAAPPRMLHAEVDRLALLGQDEPEPAAPGKEEPAVASPAPVPAPAAAPAPAPAASAAAPIADRPLSVAEAVRALLALQAKLRPEQIRESETIEELFDGVSSRRNQALLDLGAELGVGGLDGAHERALSALLADLSAKASRYQGPGRVLMAAGDDALKRLLGRHGVSRKEIAGWLSERWGLGAGWTEAVILELALAGREGSSARGGPLGSVAGAPESRAAAQTLVDELAQAVAKGRGISLARRDQAASGPSADPAALNALSARLLGPDSALARAAEALAEGTGQQIARPGLRPLPREDEAAARLEALVQEHGEAYLSLIQPLFDARRHVVFDSSWACARRDLARLVFRASNGDRAGLGAELLRLGRHAGDPVLRETASWYAGIAAARGDRALAEQLFSLVESRPPLAVRPTRPHLEASGVYQERPDPVGLQGWLREIAPLVSAGPDTAAVRAAFARLGERPLDAAGRVALVTGASPGSIALEVARQLLWGGARVVLTTSTLDEGRLAFYRRVFQESAAPGAELHVLPCNQGSLRDLEALTGWLAERGLVPDLMLPFAALKEAGSLGQDPSRAAAALRVQVLGVEALIAAVARRRKGGRPCQVVLPLSPNHGAFGGDGAYAETKAALEVLLEKVASERESWGSGAALLGARIGWVRGTGLMDANNVLAPALEARAGIRTFSAAEMGLLIAALCGSELGAAAAGRPIRVDLSAGFDRVPDLRGLVGKIRAELAESASQARRRAELQEREARLLGRAEPAPALVQPLPECPAPAPERERVPWHEVTLPLDQVVVVVGAGELGPWGSARTRFEIEVEERLSAAGVLELAWLCGMVRAERDGSWVDAETGEVVPERELGERYRERVTRAAGIRWIEPEVASYDPGRVPALATAWLDRDFSFTVSTRAEAQSFLAADPERTVIAEDASGGYVVTRKKGSEIRVPRVIRIDRAVAGTLPTGLDLTRYGVPQELAGEVDRVALMNLAATADAFLSAGLSPEELMRWLHPARVANTQGSGLGGASSLRRLYRDALLDGPRKLDVLQETLINVTAAHVVQSFVGSYGSMSHPVGACATAALSLEEGMDRILLGKADFAVAGGYDDIGFEGALGFHDMAATASSDEMAAMGVSPRAMSRPNDRRRHGFVEAHGGGTLLLCRGSVALEMGLPVLGVLAYAGTFGDGLHRSIPAPGLGAMAAALGGRQSPLGQALGRWGLTADDVALVYKHDTSTLANDLNENRLHHELQRALGRTPGNPLFAVSQKAITGHAKGGSAAWQAIGLLQALEAGVVPGNPNLESVDPAMRPFDTLAFSDQTLRPGPALPMRAGLLTSLGFGHVSAVCLLLHPDAFLAAIPEDRRAAWTRAARERREEGRLGWARAMQGISAPYARRSARRLPGADGSEAQAVAEIALLTDPAARLGAGGVYHVERR